MHWLLHIASLKSQPPHLVSCKALPVRYCSLSTACNPHSLPSDLDSLPVAEEVRAPFRRVNRISSEMCCHWHRSSRKLDSRRTVPPPASNSVLYRVGVGPVLERLDPCKEGHRSDDHRGVVAVPRRTWLLVAWICNHWIAVHVDRVLVACGYYERTKTGHVSVNLIKKQSR